MSKLTNAQKADAWRTAAACLRAWHDIGATSDEEEPLIEHIVEVIAPFCETKADTIERNAKRGVRVPR